MKATTYFLVFWLLLTVKVSLLLILARAGVDFFGSNDADYYDSYALGYVDNAVNSWPIILRALDQFSLYSRTGVSYALMFLSCLIIPLLVGALAEVSVASIRHRAYWAASVVTAAYPTVMYYSMDVFRDVFMVFVWACGLFVFKLFSAGTKRGMRIALMLLGLFFSICLYSLRPYLGLAYFTALLFGGFYSFRSFPLLRTVLVFSIGLSVMFAAGLLEPLVDYRTRFDPLKGGSTLGLQFDSLATFLPLFFKSAVIQLLGLHFSNLPSFAVFFLETLPFVLFLIYVVKNRAYSTKFIDYLLVFSIVYASIWLLGNDNFGTAVRLRIYNYLSVLIAFFVIYQRKHIALCDSTRLHNKLSGQSSSAALFVHKSV